MTWSAKAHRELNACLPKTLKIKGKTFHLVAPDGIGIHFYEDWYNPDTDEYDADEPLCGYEVRYRYPEPIRWDGAIAVDELNKMLAEQPEREYFCLQMSDNITPKALLLELRAAEKDHSDQ